MICLIHIIKRAFTKQHHDAVVNEWKRRFLANYHKSGMELISPKKKNFQYTPTVK